VKFLLPSLLLERLENYCVGKNPAGQPSTLDTAHKLTKYPTGSVGLAKACLIKEILLPSTIIAIFSLFSLRIDISLICYDKINFVNLFASKRGKSCLTKGNRHREN
jgi:hypothetical protein